MIVQADGKILICGSNLGNSFVIRLHPNGALDNSFGTGGFSQNVPVEVSTGIAFQSNGKIVVCGQHITPSLDTQYAVFRVNSNGTVDSTFGTNGLVVDAYQPGLQGNEAWDVIVQADGKILICGSHHNGITRRANIARFNSDGSPDISITPSGGAIILGAYLFTAMQYQNDGKLVAVGISTVHVGEFTAIRLWMGFNFGVSLPELENGGIVIYPNPFSEVLHVHLDKEHNGEALLTDATGRTVRHSKFERRDLSIETASLPAGVYFLTVFSGNQTITRKIISVSK
jgi:uncharacterized delta-60 repeat protein